MCGITGIIAFNELGRMFMPGIQQATASLERRGPDTFGYFVDERIALGHRRLSIQDTSPLGKQPMSDPSKRYTIVYNGEIYNFKELRKGLETKGISFQSDSDTEVLLNLYLLEKENCLKKLNGFFALAIYDKKDESLFIARDRYGIKPLVYYMDDDRFVFGSEMKSLYAYKIPKTLDFNSLRHYFQLSYIPQPYTCFQSVNKLLPGHYAIVTKRAIDVRPYYELKYGSNSLTNLSYEAQKIELVNRLRTSVQKRMIADVPLGTFLSGGIDSSIISTLAAQETTDLKTFSIGYSDEPYFDETSYAELVAKKIGSNHTTFKLSNYHLFEELDQVLNYLDEPYGDSSALPVHILSRLTKEHVTVALSGDGADEVFSGYNKHMGEFRARQGGFAAAMISAGKPLWDVLPKSRNFPMSNRIRQFQRFANGKKLSNSERYWLWCKYINEEQCSHLFSSASQAEFSDDYSERKKYLLRHFSKNGSFNEVLRTDLELVLQSDMLTKVDMMSMANSLEIRVPFLDHNVVDFAFSLPTSSKITKNMKKRIVQDAFQDILPEELYNRPKHGFEVPLLKWFRTDLRSKIEHDLLADDFIKEQGVFNLETIRGLKKQLFSNNPQEIHAQIWMMIVFQSWWKRHMS